MKKIVQFLDISEIDRISFRKDINGLRAISVLAVVFYHIGIGPFDGGWLGVDIFFVISGYLISNIIISELNNGNFSFTSFYLRRVRRILPALISILIFTIPFAYWLLTPKALIEYSKSAFASIFFYANYYFQNLDFYNAEPTKVMPLLHTWSLAIEEQFYLIFPLLCFILYKFNKKIFSLFLGLIFLYSIFLNSTTNELVKFYQIQYRAWELILGSIVMIFQKKINIKHIEKVGFTIIIFSIFYFDDSMLTLNSLEPRLLSNLGVSMVLLSSKNGFIDNLLSHKYISLIGLSSYSIYLFHQPIFAFLRLFQSKYLVNDSIYLLLSTMLALFIISYLNWKFVEKKFQSLSLKNLTIAILLGVGTVVLFTLISEEKEGFVSRYDYVPEEVLFYSLNPNIYPATYQQDNYKFFNSNCNNKLANSNYCIWFNDIKEQNIFLIGDSQTNALSVSFLTEMTSLNSKYNLIFLRGKLGRCLLSQQSDTVGTVDECSEETFNEFLSMLNVEKDIIVSFGRFDTWLTKKGENEIKCNDCDFEKVFKSRLEKISNNSLKHYIIEPIPTYDFGVADSYLYKRHPWGEPISLNLESWLAKAYDSDKFLKNLSGNNIELVSTVNLFCRDNKCFASSKDKLFYSDSNHLTLDGANILTKFLIKEIDLDNGKK